MLFSPFTTRGLTLRNRVGFSPMCTFRGRRGHATDFHRDHYAARSAGGAGLVMAEATAVEARGVIAPDDLGLWSDDHVPGLAGVVRGIHAGGAAAGIQLAHAGRKAGAYVVDDDGRTATDVVGPSPVAFDAGRPVPRALDAGELAVVRGAFVDAARRAVHAGFDLIELHMAHGYLLGSFLSPITNHRDDAFGGPSVAGRARFPLAVIAAVRAAVPDGMPLWARVSAIDPEPGGQTIDDTVAFARRARDAGVDLIDCSAGGTTPRGWLKARPGYQVKFAEAVRRDAGVPTAAVGVITDPRQADAILRDGRADVVLVGRAMRDNPAWTNDAKAFPVPSPGTAGRGDRTRPRIARTTGRPFMRLKDKVALVTGAGSGIGEAIARRLADEGAHVVVNYRPEGRHADAAIRLAKALATEGLAVPADVSKRDGVETMVAEAVKTFGRLDIAINNAGIETQKPFVDVTDDEWNKVLTVNLYGTFVVSQIAARQFIQQGGGGRLIFVSSVHEDIPFPGYTSYCASKGAVRMLMRNLAMELAPHGILCNNIAPGAIDTPINEKTLNDPEAKAAAIEEIPLGRFGRPEEVAAVAAFLASDDGSYVTGSTYYVDGGLTQQVTKY